MHTPALSPLLDAISAQAFTPEAEAVGALLEHTQSIQEHWPEITAKARGMVERLRREGLGLGVEAFLLEYGLSTKEGVAVMCLAEALLRIPDADTADRLIASSFEGAEWERHVGHSESLFVNASSWGLLMTGRMLEWGEAEGGILSRLAGRVGEPVIRESLKAAMRLVAGQFVIGETIEEALKNSRALAGQGYLFSYDMLGEGARSEAQAERYFASYLHAIRTLGKRKRGEEALFHAPGISIKLTALHPRYEWRQKDRVMAELLPRLKRLVKEAEAAGITVAIDAEEATRLDLELEMFSALFLDPEFSNYPGIGFVLQAYQKRAYHIIDLLATLARQAGRRMPVRLVKGAYWDSEVKAAQVAGLKHYPVFTKKEHSDISYLACARKLLAHPECFYPQFATHNATSIAAIEQMAGAKDFEFQRLHGMGEKLYEPIVSTTPCRIYAPIGEHRDLLAYLIRRLLENGANSSFVHLMMEKSLPLEQLLASPMDAALVRGGMEGVPLPGALYGARRNSRGLDWGNRVKVKALLASLPEHYAVPVIAATERAAAEQAMERATAAYPAWDALGVEERAVILEKASDLLEQRGAEALHLLVHEGRKTLPDALTELREAVDFCRYYAEQARLALVPQVLTGPTGERNVLSLSGRGVWVAISPWNFPLSIFMGQVAAALAGGNAVVAKPAEQTPATAAFAVQVLHEAGVPEEVAQLLPGSGEGIGQLLVEHPKTAGVVFTGSTETARRINRTLAERAGPILPLIAETGGQNCMIVDSSALIEQVVDDVMVSAFGSAGQRCSALRVLFLHEDIADAALALLAGALKELKVGEAAALDTDIGPVIDEGARAGLLEHIARMKRAAKFIAAAPLDAELAARESFVAPQIFEITDIAQLTGEVFGPVLHVIRYRAAELERVVESINGSGFGLTFGIHSRIPRFAEAVAGQVRAGNAYVNRSMTGAVVGVQPFGGEGLSGTGPKAGGPHYLQRFVTERVVSVNTAAIGGNVELLMR